MTADTVTCWIFALPFIGLFFFVYGIIEQAIQKHWATRKHREPQIFLTPLKQPQPLTKTEIPPENRGYDTPELFREDALIYVRENERAVAEHEENIRTILAQMQKRQSEKE